MDVFRRAKPYESSPKRTARAATPKPSDATATDRTTDANHPGASRSNQPDAATVVELLRPLVKEPATFESKASLICSALGLDSTATKDIVNTVKENTSSGLKPE